MVSSLSIKQSNMIRILVNDQPLVEMISLTNAKEVNGASKVRLHSGQVSLGRAASQKGKSMIPVEPTSAVIVLLPQFTSDVPPEVVGEEVVSLLALFEGYAAHEELIEENLSLLDPSGGLRLIGSVQLVLDAPRKVYLAAVVCLTPHIALVLQNYVNFVWGASPQGLTGPRPYAAPLALADDESRPFYPIPTCSRCLHRLDPTVGGTEKWKPCFCGDGQCECVGQTSCIVCRTLVKSMGSLQGPALPSTEGCTRCGTTQDIWQCLICGELGCSRYRLRHAAQHFRDSHHPFSICLSSQEIWDYAADEFTHHVVYRCHTNSEQPGRPTFNVLELGLPSGDSTAVVIPSSKGDNVGAYLDDNENTKKVCPLSEDDNDNDNETNIMFLKYDAKVDTLCAEFSAVLSAQMSQQRQEYESRLEELVGSVSSQRIPSLESPNIPTPLLSELSMEIASAVQAYQLYTSSHAEVNTVSSEEAALQTQIGALKSSIKDTMERRQDELQSLRQMVEEQRQVLADLRQNLSTRDRFTATFGAEAFAQGTTAVLPTSSSAGTRSTRRR